MSSLYVVIIFLGYFPVISLIINFFPLNKLNVLGAAK
jgi:hypothetical protein